MSVATEGRAEGLGSAVAAQSGVVLPGLEFGDVGSGTDVLAGLDSEELAVQARLAAQRKAARRSLIMVSLTQVAVIGAALGIWSWLSYGKIVPQYLISSPSAVATSFATFMSSSVGWHDIAVSVKELVLGYAIGQVAGIMVAVVLGSVRFLGRVFEPIVTALNSIPTIAIAPLFIIILGIGTASKVAISAIIVFFVMFFNCYNGMRGVPQDLVGVVRLAGAGRMGVLRYVVLPSMAPPILAGLSAGVGFGMIGVVVGEFIASSAGVGHYIIAASDSFNAANTFAGILVLLLIVITGNVGFRMVRKRILRWQK